MKKNEETQHNEFLHLQLANISKDIDLEGNVKYKINLTRNTKYATHYYNAYKGVWVSVNFDGYEMESSKHGMSEGVFLRNEIKII